MCTTKHSRKGNFNRVPNPCETKILLNIFCTIIFILYAICCYIIRLIILAGSYYTHSLHFRIFMRVDLFCKGTKTKKTTTSNCNPIPTETITLVN